MSAGSDQFQVLAVVARALTRIGAEFHAGGSFASTMHGVPRQTRDIDLVVALEHRHVDPLIAELGAEFYSDRSALERAIDRRRSANLVHLASGVKIDLFVLGRAAFDLEEFRRATPLRITIGEATVELRIKTPEDTVLRKLLWYRAGGEVSDRQWHDVQGVLEAQGERLDRAYLDRWARDLGIDDLLTRAFRSR